MTAEWTVAYLAQTVEGAVELRMTEEQAADLRDGLVWLTEGDQ